MRRERSQKRGACETTSTKMGLLQSWTCWRARWRGGWVTAGKSEVPVGYTLYSPFTTMRSLACCAGQRVGVALATHVSRNRMTGELRRETARTLTCGTVVLLLYGHVRHCRCTHE